MSRKKAKNWSETETDLLLELYKEREIIRKMDSKEIKHLDLYKELESDLKAHHVQRDAKQIKSRIKTLKDKYYQIRKELGKSGSSGQIDWHFYDIMHELLGPRPSSNRKGLDSAKIVLKDYVLKENTPLEPNVNRTAASPKKSPHKVDETICSHSTASNRIEITEKPRSEKAFRFPLKKRIFLTMEKPLIPAESEKITDQSTDSATSRENNILLTPPQSVAPQDNASFENLDDTVCSLELESGIEEGEYSVTNATHKNTSLLMSSEKEETEKKDDQPKMSKRQKLQKEKDELIETLFKQQSARTDALMTKQDELQTKTVNDISKILQQNTLLLVQAFAMAQNASSSTHFPTPTYPMFSPYLPHFSQQIAGISPACPNITTWKAGNNTAEALAPPVIPTAMPYYSQNFNHFYPPISSLGQPVSIPTVEDINSFPSANVTNSFRVTTATDDEPLNADSTLEQSAPMPIVGDISAYPCFENMANSYPVFSAYQDTSLKLDSFNVAPDRTNYITSNASAPVGTSDSVLRTSISDCDTDANLKNLDNRISDNDLVPNPVVGTNVELEGNN